MIDSVRKTCNAGEPTEFQFRATSIAFLVKNFTSAPVTVCFKAWDEKQSVMIADMTAETVVSNREPYKIKMPQQSGCAYGWTQTE